MRTMLMSGVIRRHVHVVVACRHGHGGCQGDRQVEIAKDERQGAIDRRQHESGGHEPAQEHKPEDEQSGPAWLLEVAHHFHRGVIYIRTWC